MASLAVTLVTGRTIEQGRGKDAGKLTDEYRKAASTLRLNPNDLKKLGVGSGAAVKIKTRYGEVVVQAVPSNDLPEGVAFMAYGPWANAVIGPQVDGTGTPLYKGVPAEVTPTDAPVPSQIELAEALFGKKPLAKPQRLKARPGVAGTFSSVVCAFCGSLCDDLEVEVKDGLVKTVKRACALGTAKFVEHSTNRVLKPYIRKGGELKEVSLGEAIKRAAEILASAEYPLLYGWSNTSCEAIALGVELAELTGGLMDDTTVVCHGPTALATHETGTVKATLGQIKNRADLVIYWGSNPLHAHPRHTVRYSLAKGVYVKERKERKVVVVDVRETPLAKTADMFIRVEPGKDFELLSALRMLLRDYDIEADKVAGVPIEKVYELLEMMRTAKFGVIFLGLGLTESRGKSRNLEEAIRLVQDLNDWTKFVLLAMRGHYNVTGANQVKLWLTGFPFAVDFRRGYPRYNVATTSAVTALANGDVDAAFIIASDPIANFPAEAAKHLTEIPLIAVEPKWSLTASLADVIIPSAFVGIEAEGSAYRMDGVPLRLKKLVDPPPGVPTDVEVLEMLIKEVKKLKGVTS